MKAQDETALPPLYTVDEVADILRVTHETVRSWLKSEELEGFKLGRSWRVSRASLEAFVKESYS